MASRVAKEFKTIGPYGIENFQENLNTAWNYTLVSSLPPKIKIVTVLVKITNNYNIGQKIVDKFRKLILWNVLQLLFRDFLAQITKLAKHFRDFLKVS